MLILACGARPNFVKVAALSKALSKGNVQYCIVNTGQHYDTMLSDVFFSDLDIPKPKYNIGCGNIKKRVCRINFIKEEFKKICEKENPSLTVVVGDVDSTIACAIGSKLAGVPVAHVEAGLRSFDNTMPEELNRIGTDMISDIFFVSERTAVSNLVDEGYDSSRIFHVGNVMIDSLVGALNKIKELEDDGIIGAKCVLSEYIKDTYKNYGVVTLHRAELDDSKLISIIGVLNQINADNQIIFPCHPKTRQRIIEVADMSGINIEFTLLDPFGYLDFINLVKDSRFVLTDSGGLQEETSWLGVPCGTIRENTERPCTLDLGTNELLGYSSSAIKRFVENVFNAEEWEKEVRKIDTILSKGNRGDDGDCQAEKPDLPDPPEFLLSTYEFWDGKASDRIVDILKEENLC